MNDHTVTEPIVAPKPSSSSSSPTLSSERDNPFSKVGNVVLSDSDEDEVLEPENLVGGGNELEDDLDDYDFDEYSKQIQDLPGNLDVFNAIYYTNLQAPRK